MRRTKPFNYLTLLAVIWLVFTTCLVVWWWLFALNRLADLDPSAHRMILWEGGFLVLVVLGGGSALIYFTHDYERKHERMKLFFATFAHDLRTSISRLRLQADLLQEKESASAELERMMSNIQKLDIQLENSLWLANLSESRLMEEEFRLSEVLSSLRNEFPELTIDLNRDADIRADRRALRAVLRNLFHNSLIHGQADRVFLRVASSGPGQVELQVSDNGKGLTASIQDLGRNPLSARESAGNGIGLYLTRQLLRRMSGELSFRNSPRFVNCVLIHGKLREAGT